MTRPEAGTGGDSFRYLPASEPTAQRIYTLLWVTVLLLFLGKLIALRLRSAAVSAFELAMVFLTALLLSPITFTTHLVPLLFVFAVLLSVRPGERGGPVRLLAAVLVLGMAVCGLSGRDLAGDWAYENVAGYSICAWTMLVAFGSMVVAAGGRGRVRP